MLELPMRWIGREARQAESVKLAKGAHWFDFASLFGEVVEAELCAGPPQSGGGATLGAAGASSTGMWLLARFATLDGASCMYEALTDRYIYNQSNKQVDDWYPATCSIGEGAVLLERLRGPSVVAGSCGGVGATVSVPAPVGGADGEAKFTLRRCGRGRAVPGILRPPPDAVPVTLARKRLVFGRMDYCDVVLPHPHVSKAHATVILQELEGSGQVIMLQDTSTNGAWFNGRKLEPGQFLQMRPRDKVSFLQPGPVLDEDPLTYELWPGAESGATASAAPGPRPAVAPAAATKAGSIGPAAGPTAAASASAQRQMRSRSRSRSPSALQMLRALGGVDVAAGPNDIGPWLRNLGVGDYEAKLVEDFDSVSQIVDLYRNSIDEFFEDCAIQDPAHREIFSTAILAGADRREA
jgi:hypothetical protein